MNSKNVFAVAIFMIIFVGVYSQSAIALSSSQSSKIGFQDGCADASIKHPTSPTDLHFNRHSNAHHHSKMYLLNYAAGLVKCGK